MTTPVNILATKPVLPKCLGGDGMISKAEQYRCYGEKALASAKQASCEEEKAELLKIAQAWFELADDQSGTPSQSDSCN